MDKIQTLSLVKDVRSNIEMKEIQSIRLHVPQQVEGSPRGSISAVNNVKLEFVLPLGVLVTGKITNVLVPFSNIQGVYFELNK